MLRIEYDPREVWKRIIPFQGVPLLALLYAAGVNSGYLAVRSTDGIMVAVLVGLIMYSLMMALLIKSLYRPVLLSIDKDILIWRPYFSVVKRIIPRLTTVEVSKNEVKLSPPLSGIPGTKTDGNVTIFPLPQALKEVKNGKIIIR